MCVCVCVSVCVCVCVSVSFFFLSLSLSLCLSRSLSPKKTCRCTVMWFLYDAALHLPRGQFSPPTSSQVSGRCCVNARLNWSAQLTVLTLPSLKELVARVCAKSKSQDVLKGKSDSESQEYQQRLQEELFAFISSGTDLMRKRFSPSHYPEVQQWLREGYTVRSVQATPVQGEECSVS